MLERTMRFDGFCTEGEESFSVGSMLFLSPEAGEEEGLYRFLRDEAEQSGERSLAVVLDARAEFFSVQIRALFRAAVYGTFSLLYGGLLSHAALSDTLRTTHRVFCELLEDGREFDGYIPKGILIDAPIWLLSDLPTEGIDEWCLDLPRLLSGLGGASEEASLSHWTELCGALFPKQKNALLLRAILSEALLLRATLPFLLEHGITRWYLPIPDRSEPKEKRL